MIKRNVLFFALSICLGTGLYAQEKDKDAMVRKVFTIMKNGDEQGFVKLFPDAAVTKAFIKETFIRDSSMAGMKDMMDAFLAKITDEELQKEYREDYRRARKYAEVANIDLSKAIYVSHTADSAKDEDDEMLVSKLSGKIYFTVDTANYFMRFNNIIYFDNQGWYGVNIRRIDKKSNEFEPDMPPPMEESVSVEEVKDTVEMPPPPPPPPAKNKTQQKASPAKPGTKPTSSKTTSKSTTPARKQD